MSEQYATSAVTAGITDEKQQRAQAQWLRDGTVPAEYLEALYDAATNTKPTPVPDRQLFNR